MKHDQADELRQLVRQAAKPAVALGPAPRLIVASGGKGGIGTTSVSLNLAVALARLGNRSVWIDADLNHGGGADWWRAGQRGSIVDVLARGRTIHEVLERGPAGVQILPGAWAPGELAQVSEKAERRFIAELQHLGLHADAVVVDLGSARNPFVRRFWQAADAVLLVTAADATSVMESYAAIKVMLAGEPTSAVHTLVNRASSTEAADAADRIRRACRRFLGVEVNDLGNLPATDEIAATTDAGQAYLGAATGGLLAQHMEALADTLWKRLTPQAPRGAQDRRSAA